MRLATVVACLAASCAPDAFAQCVDTDGDGYGNPASAACPFAFLDCNDGWASTYPGAPEPCDGFDNDCNGLIDDDPVCDRTCDPPEAVGGDRLLSSGGGIGAGSRPRTAWNGGGFATAWSDARGGRDAIFVAFADESGSRLGGEIAVSASAGWAKDPAIAWTGSGYGVAWADSRDGALEIYFTLLDLTGAKLFPEVALTAGEEISGWPDLAWNGRNFGIVWTGESSGLSFAAVDRAGGRTGPVTSVATHTAWPNRAAIAWTGEEFAVAWSGVDGGRGQVFLQRLSAAGDLLGGPAPVTANPTASEASNPRLTWSGVASPSPGTTGGWAATAPSSRGSTPRARSSARTSRSRTPSRSTRTWRGPGRSSASRGANRGTGSRGRSSSRRSTRAAFPSSPPSASPQAPSRSTTPAWPGPASATGSRRASRPGRGAS